MRLEEFNALTVKPKMPPQLTADAHGNRTLLFGYTCERLTWHVYQQERSINLFVYDAGGKMQRHVCSGLIGMERLIPDKRLYPERCDWIFCKEVMSAGYHLPFLAFDTSYTHPGPYHGKLATDPPGPYERRHV